MAGPAEAVPALAQLERAEAAAVAGTGMAALLAAFTAVVQVADHFVADGSLYDGTHTSLTRQMCRFLRLSAEAMLFLACPIHDDIWQKV